MLVFREGSFYISTVCVCACACMLVRVCACACPCSTGTPANVNYKEVRDLLLSIKGVKTVHNLHIWALTVNQAVLSAHVAIGKNEIFVVVSIHF